jgi:hypothetical protein
MFVIQTTCGTTMSTSAIGSNITKPRTFELLLTLPIHISSDHPTHLPPSHLEIIFWRYASGSTSLMRRFSFTDHSIFATVNVRKTRDRVSQDDWKCLLKLRDCYNNAPPALDLPTYSVHVDRGVHTTFTCPDVSAHVKHVTTMRAQSGTKCIVDQMSTRRRPPRFHFFPRLYISVQISQIHDLVSRGTPLALCSLV